MRVGYMRQSITSSSSESPYTIVKAPKISNPITKNIRYIQTKLRIQRLLSDADDKVLKKSIHCIAKKIFNDYYSFMQFILTYSKHEQLSEIHQIIRLQKLKRSKENDNINNDIDDNMIDDNVINDNMIDDNITDNIDHNTDDNIDDNKSDLFETLANENIDYICGYLDHSDIEKFKQTSRQIAIICLDQMRKISVGILNTNSMENTFYEINCKHITHYVQKSRYVDTTRFYSLQEEWETIYEIPEKYQLLFHIKRFGRYYNSHYSFEIVNINKLHDTQIQNTQSYLLVDTRNVLIVDEYRHSQHLKDRNQLKNIENIHNYKIMFIEYFDIMTQSFELLHIILCAYNVTFKGFINFIEETICDNNNLNYCLKQMYNDNINDKIILYEHIQNNKTMRRIHIHTSHFNSDNCIFYTFQLNPSHPWFNKNNIFDNIKTKCEKNLEYFVLEANQYFCKNININVKLLNNKNILQSCIKKYYNYRLNEEQNNLFQSDIQNIYKLCNNETFTIVIHKELTVEILKKKISRLFDNLIEPKYIELFHHNFGCARLKCNSIISSITSTYYNCHTLDISCDIVLYDTNLYWIHNNEYQFYNIRIFKPSLCPYPLYFKNDILNIRIYYKKKFKCKEFIGVIFEMMLKSSDHILYEEFNDLLNIYYDFNNNKEIDCDCIEEIESLIMNDKITCVLQESQIKHNTKKSPQHPKIFNLKDEYKTPCPQITNWDLFIIKIKPSQKCNNIKLDIKFLLDIGSKWYKKQKLNAKTNINDIKHLHFIGLPLTIWINKMDSIQNIIQKYLYKCEKYIAYCYRINYTSHKVMTIQKRLWNVYKPAIEFIYNSPQDFLVFKVTRLKIWNLQINILMYSINCHGSLYNDLLINNHVTIIINNNKYNGIVEKRNIDKYNNTIYKIKFDMFEERKSKWVKFNQIQIQDNIICCDKFQIGDKVQVRNKNNEWLDIGGEIHKLFVGANGIVCEVVFPHFDSCKYMFLAIKDVRIRHEIDSLSGIWISEDEEFLFVLYEDLNTSDIIGFMKIKNKTECEIIGNKKDNNYYDIIQVFINDNKQIQLTAKLYDNCNKIELKQVGINNIWKLELKSKRYNDDLFDELQQYLMNHNNTNSSNINISTRKRQRSDESTNVMDIQQHLVNKPNIKFKYIPPKKKLRVMSGISDISNNNNNNSNNNRNVDFQQIKSNGAPYNCPFCVLLSFEVWSDWKLHWYQSHNTKYFENKNKK